MKLQELLDKDIDSIGDDHIGSNTEETPMKEGAFDVPDNDKISFIQEKVYEILDMLGMDLTDDSLRGTPRRVAKMFVNEIFSGLNPKNRPEMSTFENKYNYGEMLVEKNITLYSTCEHHLLPFKGKAHVAYIPVERIVGISKLARLVELHTKKLQNQERITKGIADDLEQHLNPLGAAVIIEASHGCMKCRGVKKQNSIMTTSAMRGVFFDKNEARAELMQLIQSPPL